VEANMGQRPNDGVDAGFTNQSTIEAMSQKQVDLIGACPSEAELHSAVGSAWVGPDFYHRL